MVVWDLIGANSESIDADRLEIYIIVPPKERGGKYKQSPIDEYRAKEEEERKLERQ